MPTVLRCFFSSRRRHTRWPRDWSSDVCSSDLSRRCPRRNVTVADDTVFIGSFNLSHSGEDNAENVLEIEDPKLADRMADFRSEERRVGKEGRLRVDDGDRTERDYIAGRQSASA